MLIESILIREGGTWVEMDGVSYHFAPTPAGPHICDIDDPKHIGAFLAIPEGYRVFDTQQGPALPGSAGAAGDGEGASPSSGAGTPDLDAMSRDELAALYEERTGTKPHHLLGEAKLRKLVAEILAGG